MRYLLILIAVLYVVFPRDLIPDMMPIIGWLDDLLAVYLVWRYLIRPYLRPRPSSDRSRPAPEPPDDTAPRSPYDILGIPSTASKAQIREAYRKLAAQYHPDKVTHLGEDFQRLAEQRFKEINSAYQSLTQ